MVHAGVAGGRRHEHPPRRVRIDILNLILPLPETRISKTLNRTAHPTITVPININTVCYQDRPATPLIVITNATAAAAITAYKKANLR
jgi:hypothetical protein